MPLISRVTVASFAAADIGVKRRYISNPRAARIVRVFMVNPPPAQLYTLKVGMDDAANPTANPTAPAAARDFLPVRGKTSTAALLALPG